MKKALFVLICLTCGICYAEVSEDMFNSSKNAVTGEETVQTFTGKPAILIEKTEQGNDETNSNKNLSSIPLEKNVLQIPIKTLFGHPKTAAFIDHTTDFLSLVQIIDDDTVQVTEQIQFINTREGMIFERSFPKHLVGEDHKKLKPEYQMLSVIRDNVSVKFEQQDSSDDLKITLQRPLPKGVHRLTLKYLITGLIQKDNSLARISVPVMGNKWGQMIERLNIVVMMPKKSNFYKKEVLFGSNNQKIPENISATEDASGNLVFQTTHLTPAYTEIKLNILTDKAILPQKEKNISVQTIILGCYVGVLLLYVFLSILTDRFKKWKNPLTVSRKISPVLWMSELKINLTQKQKDNLMEMKVPLLGLAQKGLLGRVLAYFRFNLEYVLGVILLIFGTELILSYWKVYLPISFKSMIMLLNVLVLVVMDYLGTQFKLEKLKNMLKKTLLETPQGINLATREIKPYYILAVCLGFGHIWKKRLIDNNPSYGELSCFKKEKV